jgi:hypothetical protein
MQEKARDLGRGLESLRDDHFAISSLTTAFRDAVWELTFLWAAVRTILETTAMITRANRIFMNFRS